MILSYFSVGLSFIPAGALYALYGDQSWPSALFSLVFGFMCADKAWRLTAQFRNPRKGD